MSGDEEPKAHRRLAEYFADEGRQPLFMAEFPVLANRRKCTELPYHCARSGGIDAELRDAIGEIPWRLIDKAIGTISQHSDHDKQWDIGKRALTVAVRFARDAIEIDHVFLRSFMEVFARLRPNLRSRALMEGQDGIVTGEELWDEAKSAFYDARDSAVTPEEIAYFKDEENNLVFRHGPPAW